MNNILKILKTSYSNYIYLKCCDKEEVSGIEYDIYYDYYIKLLDLYNKYIYLKNT